MEGKKRSNSSFSEKWFKSKMKNIVKVHKLKGVNKLRA